MPDTPEVIDISPARAVECLTAGRFVEAEHIIDRLLVGQPQSPTSWTLAAKVRQAKGDFAGMVSAAKSARDLSKAGLNEAFLYCEALIFSGQFQLLRDELALLEETIALADTRALSKLSEFYTHCGAFEDAERLADRALATAPHDAGLLFNRAAARIAIGRHDEAEGDLDMVIKRQPRDYDAYYNRATLRKQTQDNNHITELRELRRLVSPCPPALGYALAKELEDLGRWTESFAALEEGARARRAMLPYRVETDLEAMAQIANTFGAERLSGVKEAASDTGPIFVLGLPRTGTTLIDRILSSHADISSVGEVDDMPLSLTAATMGASDKGDRIRRAASIDMEGLGTQYWRRLQGRINANTIVDKTPSNFLYIGLIALAMPTAKIVHVQRHPIAAGYAIYKTLFRMGYPYSYDLTDLGRYIAGYQRLMDHWRKALPGRLIEVAYEDLVTEPEQTVRTLLSACHMQWDEGCMAFYANAAPSATASAAQVRQPIHTASVDLWRQYETQLQPLRDAIIQECGDPKW